MLVGRSVYLLFTVHGRKDDLSSFVVLHSEFLYYLLETVVLGLSLATTAFTSTVQSCCCCHNYELHLDALNISVGFASIQLSSICGNVQSVNGLLCKSS